MKTFWQRVERWRSSHRRNAWQLPIYLLRRRREAGFDRKPAEGTRLQGDRLPKVQLVRVESDEQKDTLANLYWRNPSKNLIAPDSDSALESVLASGVVYYLVVDASGRTVGALGYRESDHILMHIVTDYPARRKGFGLAAQKALEDKIRGDGGSEIRSFVFEENQRMIARYENGGWVEIDRYSDFGRRIVVFSKAL